MRKLLFIILIGFASCQTEKKDITGHWDVLKQYSDAAEITPSNPGITFREDGILELDWNQKPNMKLPQTKYRISNDTIYWVSYTDESNEGSRENKLIIEWEGENLILRADKNNYTVLKRTAE